MEKSILMNTMEEVAKRGLSLTSDPNSVMEMFNDIGRALLIAISKEVKGNLKDGETKSFEIIPGLFSLECTSKGGTVIPEIIMATELQTAVKEGGDFCPTNDPNLMPSEIWEGQEKATFENYKNENFAQ